MGNTNNVPLQQQLKEIYADFMSLQEESEGADRMKKLKKFNTQLSDFVKQVIQFIQDMQEQIQNRKKLQEIIEGAQVQPQTYEGFYKDQISFYRNCLNQFGQIKIQTRDKCTMALTAKQVLLLLRLARDTNILTEKQLKPYFYFLQTNFKTESQETLSYESLRKKYSQLDKSTITQVKNMLEAMLRILKHYQATTE